ncbi:MAG TPA: 2-oxo acid dehydrogenase subunit E2 [Candidatus Binataceae bacterium]
MAIVIQMPKLGHTMTEGKVLKWHKRPGESVGEGEVVLTIESDKTEVEIESPGAGVMGALSAGEGEVVAVGGRLGVIEQAGEPMSPATPVGLAPTPGKSYAGAAKTGAAVTSATPSRALASPRAKKLASQNGVDLGAINGSGTNGLVTEDDVRRVIESRGALAPKRSAAASATPGPSAALSPARREKLTRIQAVGARNLTASWNAIPHFVQMSRVDMSRTLEARKALSDGATRHSITDFVLAATVRALKENPRINASYADGEMLIYDQINLGVAVDTPEGLIVPVLHGADALDLGGLGAQVAKLAEKARAKRLTPAELEGATFTVSNLGAFGVENGTPVIFAPQSALMFVGAIRDEVLAVDGRAEVRPAMQIAIAYDHRGIDGATAARFTTRVKAILEEGEFGAPKPQPPAKVREVRIDAIGNAMHTRVSHGGHSWELHGEAPGDPSPVEGFLGALGSCLLMSLRAAARARKLELGRTSMVARSNEKGHVESIEMELRVETPESDDKLHKLIEIAERGCHVRRLLRDQVPIKLSVERI